MSDNHIFAGVLGAMCGDAAGATLEFLRGPFSDAQIDEAMALPGGGRLEVGPGQITDDGEMMLALLRGLCARGDKTDKLDAIAFQYVQWLRSNPFDVGGTTTAALRVFAQDKGLAPAGLAARMALNTAHVNQGSKANGSLMRCIAVAAYGALAGSTVDEIAELAMADAALTHPNLVCQHAAAVYCIAAASLMCRPGDADHAIRTAAAWCERHACDEVWRYLNEALNSDTYLDDCRRQIGFVKHGFVMAFMHLNKRSTYDVALRTTLRPGGDTDTNACIVGGLIGALWGREGLPAGMVEKVTRWPVQGSWIERPAWLHPCRVAPLLGALRVSVDM